MSIGIRIANMTSAEVVCASTDAAGISSRGNQTFLIRSAFARSDPLPSCTDDWKKPHVARPVSTNSG